MNNKFIGSWQITKSEQWDPKMLNMDQTAIIEINKNGFGSFNFCAVEADIDCRISKNKKEKLEFSFNGVDVRPSKWYRLDQT